MLYIYVIMWTKLVYCALGRQYSRSVINLLLIYRSKIAFHSTEVMSLNVGWCSVSQWKCKDKVSSDDLCCGLAGQRKGHLREMCIIASVNLPGLCDAILFTPLSSFTRQMCAFPVRSSSQDTIHHGNIQTSFTNLHQSLLSS